MSQNVVARRDTGRYFYRPAVVVGDEHIGSPVSVRDVGVQQPKLVNFEELKCSFVDGLTRPVTVC